MVALGVRWEARGHGIFVTKLLRLGMRWWAGGVDHDPSPLQSLGALEHSRVVMAWDPAATCACAWCQGLHAPVCWELGLLCLLDLEVKDIVCH